MQFIKHNFHDNFINSLNYDNQLHDELIKDEIAKLIVFRKNDVINILQSCGFVVNNKTPDKKIIRLLEKYMPDNRVLRQNITILINQSNPGIQGKVEYVNANGRTRTEISVKNKGLEEKISNSLSECFSADGTELKDKVNAHKENKNIIDKLKIPVSTRKIIIRTAIITSIAWIACIIAYRVVKRRVSESSYEASRKIQQPVIQDPSVGGSPSPQGYQPPTGIEGVS